jgi:hypothetical protein
MPLNFHGHLLAGSAKTIMLPLNIPLDTSPRMISMSGLTWTSTILGEMEIDPDLARWCYYRLTLNPIDNVGSAESVLLRTAVWRFIEALYSNWERVVTYLPKKTVELVIDEFHQMAKISYEYPVMVWEYFHGESQGTWVPNTLARLPSLESINEFYQLPHMRSMYINMYNQDFCNARDRDAEKAYRRALAERNKRLNRAARQQSRSGRKE